MTWAAVALIRPLAWEFPYTTRMALKKKKKRKKKEIQRIIMESYYHYCFASNHIFDNVQEGKKLSSDAVTVRLLMMCITAGFNFTTKSTCVTIRTE